jgi:hypothetical protein
MSAPEASKVLELVVFELRDGVTREQFLATVDALSEWVKAQPGFISHELAHDPTADRWIDLVWWHTMEDALAAAQAAASSESCAPMFALIDTAATQMLHGQLAVAPVDGAATEPSA